MTNEDGSARRWASVRTYVVVIGSGFLFGAIDQYLGTVHVASRVGWWTITVSGMSAPWLIVPFIVGCTQMHRRRAVALGFVVTMAALGGYFYASNSFLEGVPLANAWPRIATMASTDSNLMWIAGGAITGPLYGYLGHRWRVARSRVAAALVAVALCLEPLARGTLGRFVFGGLAGSRAVWVAEIAVGVAVGAAFAAGVLLQRRQADLTR